jgi:hypothetical protein
MRYGKNFQEIEDAKYNVYKEEEHVPFSYIYD